MKKQIHPEPEQYAIEVDKHRPKEQAVPITIITEEHSQESYTKQFQTGHLYETP